ncbi:MULTISPECIES: FHA domain-containing protein [Cyanophyceae]|uniref:FHA domain-containing protein n=1 Tax=Cyanophyceae TaxID=3028117 RepID=UPI00232B4F01|nr:MULTISPECIES: FHA domain-containing protein [Cyanophyceae]MDB9355750.1 FHA domain-containing protein [Nodularia spumigena CS-587/03]MDB9341359.1 FHA domain-containing protein [Nodularia spumigena CS-589/07]MDB9399154.1 FHA domain-containing protein [Microcystis aeruginosa CS-567/02-A1]MDB9500211.1 FHA domain-containing protein [Nodularia spumigena CS-336/02]MDB9533477.1 FHA domain-containing protein [Nodularia spumigena CS-1038]
MKVKITSPTLNEVNELDLTLATTQKGECVIGRSPDCDLPLEDADVSRIHGKFFVQGGNYYFCDLGSRNGSIINNKLAEKNLPYLLKDGDSIQIGDYVLILEQITPIAEQLPETVFRVIDPSLFSGRQAFENLNPANITNPASEVISEFTEEVISQNQEEVEASEDNEVITASENLIAEERTFVQPQDIASQPPEIVSEITSNDSDEDVDLSTPVSQEFTIVQPRDLLFQPSPSTSVMPTTDSNDVVDLDTDNSGAVETLEVVSEVHPEANTNIDPVTEDTSVELSATFNQAPELVNNVESNDSDEDVDLSPSVLQEFTTVQPRDLLFQPSPSTSVMPTTDSNDTVDLDTDNSGEVETLEVVSEVHPEANTNIDPVTEDTSVKLSASFNQAPELVNNVDTEATELVPEALNESQTEVIIVPENNIQASAEVTEVFSNQYVDFSSTRTEEVSEEPTTADVFFTAEALEIEEFFSTEEAREEPTTADVFSTEESLKIEESISTEQVHDALELVRQTPEEVAEVEEALAVENVEADTESEPNQMTIQKNIVLIAHESKKSELIQLVVQYQEFFSQSLTISWQSVSAVLNQQAGITVSQEIPPAISGGYQKINSLLNSGDILAVIFLRDFLTPQPGQANEEALLRTCNINQVLLATNLKTAEAIIHYLEQITK